MNTLLRTCKCHWVGEENHHWGHSAERRAFMPPGTQPRFAPDAVVMGRHLKVALHIDFTQERVWGRTTHECEVQGASLNSVRFDATALEIEGVWLNGRAASYDYDGRSILIHLPRPMTRGRTFKVEFDHAVTRPAAGL